MKKSVFTLTVILVIPTTAVAQRYHSNRHCSQLFTVAMGKRAGRAIYRGTRQVTLQNLRLLGYIERCQVNPDDQSVVRSFNHHQRTLWLQRREPHRSVSATAPSGLVTCIVQHESGGNSQAVNPNGHYGLGQWDIATWLAQGGGQFGPSPLDATYDEQLQIIENAVAHGQASAWTPYDGC